MESIPGTHTRLKIRALGDAEHTVYSIRENRTKVGICTILVHRKISERRELVDRRRGGKGLKEEGRRGRS